jgi:hypothetical protein
MTSQNPEVFECPNAHLPGAREVRSVEPQATNPIRMRRAIRTECSAVLGCGVSRAIATRQKRNRDNLGPLEEYSMRDIFSGRSKALPIFATSV